MVDILSEGRKIESRRQLEAFLSNELEMKQAQARERPQRRGGGRSKRTRSEAPKARKGLDSRDVN